MRLIDADELIEYIKAFEIGTSISSDQKEFIDCVNRQSTVFDIDGVLKRLDEEIDLNPISNYEKGYNAAISKAYNIVESGKAK